MKPFLSTITMSRPVEPQDAGWINAMIEMSDEDTRRRHAESEYVWDFIRDEIALRRKGM